MALSPRNRCGSSTALKRSGPVWCRGTGPGPWAGDLIKGACNRSAVGTGIERKTWLSFSAVQASSNRSGGSIVAKNARLHRRSGAGRIYPPDEAPARRVAQEHDLRPRLGEDLPPGTGASAEDRHLHLAIRTRPGSVARTRTPTGGYASSSPRAPTSGSISQTGLNDVARLMNQRPRKTHSWKTPEEAMAEERAAFRSTVALET